MQDEILKKIICTRMKFDIEGYDTCNCFILLIRITKNYTCNYYNWTWERTTKNVGLLASRRHPAGLQCAEGKESTWSPICNSIGYSIWKPLVTPIRPRNKAIKTSHMNLFYVIACQYPDIDHVTESERWVWVRFGCKGRGWVRVECDGAVHYAVALR